MDVIKILLALCDFATPCLWLLTLKDCLRARLLRFTTTDLWMTGLLTLRENQILPTLNGLVWWLTLFTLNGLVWWLTLFTIWTFRLHTLQELTDLMRFNGLTCKDLQMTALLTLREQSDLPTLNGLVWWLTLFTIWKFRLRTSQKLIDLLTFNGLMCWLTLLRLLILLSFTIVKQIYLQSMVQQVY